MIRTVLVDSSAEYLRTERLSSSDVFSLSAELDETQKLSASAPIQTRPMTPGQTTIPQTPDSTAEPTQSRTELQTPLPSPSPSAMWSASALYEASVKLPNSSDLISSNSFEASSKGEGTDAFPGSARFNASGNFLNTNLIRTIPVNSSSEYLGTERLNRSEILSLSSKLHETKNLFASSAVEASSTLDASSSGPKSNPFIGPTILSGSKFYENSIVLTDSGTLPLSTEFDETRKFSLSASIENSSPLRVSELSHSCDLTPSLKFPVTKVISDATAKSFLISDSFASSTQFHESMLLLISASIASSDDIVTFPDESTATQRESPATFWPSTAETGESSAETPPEASSEPPSSAQQKSSTIIIVGTLAALVLVICAGIFLLFLFRRHEPTPELPEEMSEGPELPIGDIESFSTRLAGEWENPNGLSGDDDDGAGDDDDVEIGSVEVGSDRLAAE